MAADTNKIKYGFRSLYYSTLKGTTYEQPKQWKGAKSITLDPEGETSTFYADDTAYFATNSNNGYSGKLEMAYLSDDVLKDIFGYVETEDGMLAEDANVLPKEVALLFEFQGDANATRHILYKVVFARPSEEGETREKSIDPKTTSMDITVVPVEDKEHNWVKAKAVKGATNYDTFFTTAPTLPKAKSMA